MGELFLDYESLPRRRKRAIDNDGDGALVLAVCYAVHAVLVFGVELRLHHEDARGLSFEDLGDEIRDNFVTLWPIRHGTLVAILLFSIWPRHAGGRPSDCAESV
jgi:hypothetical protein